MKKNPKKSPRKMDSGKNRDEKNPKKRPPRSVHHLFSSTIFSYPSVLHTFFLSLFHTSLPPTSRQLPELTPGIFTLFLICLTSMKWKLASRALPLPRLLAHLTKKKKTRVRLPFFLSIFKFLQLLKTPLNHAINRSINQT